MVIEAIGGAGKSTLSWHWLKERANKVIPNLAGSLWYSFYEGGADMAAFAAYALAYATGRPLKEFRGRKTSDLARSLIAALHEGHFLLVLDGLERVLVAYHRLDASQARDDEVPAGSDDRACTKPTDAELLRQLLAALPSKILVTSRLMPTALTNTAGRPLPGVRHRTLGGMHPDDAIAMMRGLGIRGDAPAIIRYLKENFDNHPLVVGIVGGLIANYVRDPGNFDRWAADPQGGAALHLAQLDLKQRRTHILAAALNGLEPDVRQLLSFIATLGYPVPFDTIAVLNPFSCPDSAEDTETSREKDSGQPSDALPRLVSALQELERRGLLQWDRQKNRYDLHPVVRGYAFDVLEQRERTDISNRIVDHFESKPPDRYSDVKTLADVQQSITIIRALIHADRLDDATEFFSGDFARALLFSIEDYHEILALLKPVFPNGFQALPKVAAVRHQRYLLNEAGLALRGLNRLSEARESFTEGLRLEIAESNGTETRIRLTNLALTDIDDNRVARSLAAFQLACTLSETIQDQQSLARSHCDLMATYAETGFFELAESEYAAFRQLPMPTSWATYRPGDIEALLCRLRFYQGSLTSELLNQAEAAAHAGNNRRRLRLLSGLRGELALQAGEPLSAIAEFERAIEMAQTVGIPSGVFEASLALAKACSGEQQQAAEICDRLRDLPDPPHLELAETYAQLGVTERAREHALAGYLWAWADGPQYSRWWELRRCRAVLEALGEPEPSLPAFDPATAEPVPYETEIRVLIEKLRKQKREP
jgi:tetratricopeptide (TPR) repeat protein